MDNRSHDIIVIGGGHAGIEAALAAARIGAAVLLVTHSRDEIGRMPCNPAIGGLGKGHLVREIDVLGGEMGRAIDATGIQFRILNRRKGPAVQSPRAQADKQLYQQYMLHAVTEQPRLDVLEGEAAGLLIESGKPPRRRVAGVKMEDGTEIAGSRVILATGTFLRGLMHVGDRRSAGGREGARSAEGLSGDLARMGFELRRLKTGTPPRLHRDSIDYDVLQEQPGDDDPQPFSFRTDAFEPDQVPCHLTHTNSKTHELIRMNLEHSPLYAGIIEGRGPRYCPSIEDKVVRFADRDRHLVFLEPEGRINREIYVNGLSTSLPEEVQLDMVRTIEGLEKAELIRFGYAVEYDSIPSYQVGAALESKLVDGLYLSGQIIGTSGYEEASAQGLVAGVNAVRSLNNQPSLIIERSQAYIGVLIDDLVTKDITEPYRMFTSRAEHRLRIRCDNTVSRLASCSEEIGLLGEGDLDLLRRRVRAADRLASHLRHDSGARCGEFDGMPPAQWLKRPDNELKGVLEGDGGETALGKEIRELVGGILGNRAPARMTADVVKQVQTDIKYEGYIAKHDRLLQKQKHLDNLELPSDFDYMGVGALSLEAREKLARMRPATLGQASRIDGVRAGDLAVLTVVIRRLWASREDDNTPIS